MWKKKKNKQFLILNHMKIPVKNKQTKEEVVFASW
jgi:hypothetical protein